MMESAWERTPYLEFVHRRVRELLRLRGAEARNLDVGSHRIHCYTAGPEDAGEAVVLVHGLGDSAHTWTGVLPRLAQRRRVYAFDLPGHGFSPLPPSREFLRVREHVDLLDAFCATLVPDTPYALVGHSLGGWIAAEHAVAQPAPLSRLVLVAPAGLTYEGMGRELDLLRVSTEADVKRLWRRACYRVPWELRVLRREVARLFQSPTIREFVARMNGADILSEEDLERIRVPTTLVWGRNDGLVPPALAERFQAALPEGNCIWIDRCGHAPQLERPRAYLQALEEALRDPPEPRAIPQ